MELLLLLALIPALLFASPNDTIPSTTLFSSTASQTLPYKTRSTSAPNIIRGFPILTRLKVDWEKSSPCQGLVLLVLNFTEKPNALCYETIMKYDLEKLGRDICEEMKCGMFLDFKLANNKMGYIIKENVTLTKCSQVYINCEDSKELVTYKALTGVLLTLVLAVVVLQFARPTYIAIRKRFSQKRQNRWIGPTQSQSVSYHRGQAAHSDNNMVKRQSYPGLERLTVNPSREPSSNRNSDYDSYSYH
ncbi:hypothetical protein P4O66_002189 [Electrophorus voltai]|uniref:Uncharacterized protein n=2 Tax=Electrophorus TaxID=8004 RepID=A0AAD9DTH6_9TELE|nr:hypothetical protein P4O66_002189 [Electrophorus voltai]